MKEVLEAQKSYIRIASMLEGYQSMSKTELANGYCDAEDSMKTAKKNNDDRGVFKYDSLRSYFFAALMLRYWFKIFKWMENSSSLELPPIEFVDWLDEALRYGLEHRAWRDPSKAVYNDPNGPDKVFNQCCESERLIKYQHYNKQKRKGTTRVDNLDIMLEENGDEATKYANLAVEENTYDSVNAMIKTFMDRNEGLEALIIDGIANWDTYKVIKEKRVLTEENNDSKEKTYTHIKNEFDPRSLVRHLNNVDEDYVKKFFAAFGKDSELCKATMDKLTAMNNTKLYKYIQKTILEVRNTPDLLNCLIA